MTAIATRSFLLASAVASVLSLTPVSAQNVLSIRENGLYGLIDLQGNILVSPRFHEIGPFTEGIAPAREEGLYGYIDTTGAWQISPRFDIADTFSFGVAVTRKAGELCLVNRFGSELGGFDYAEVSVIGDDRLQVTAEDGRTGIIDFSGTVVLELQHVYLQPPLSGTGGLVLQWEGSPEERRFSAVDYNGREIVPRGRYHHIDFYRGGYSMVSNYRGEECTERYFIDSKGRPAYRTQNAGFMPGYSDYPSHGMVAVSTHEFERVTDSLFAVGVINSEGELLFRSREYTGLRPILPDRIAAISTRTSEEDDTWLIDRQGNRIAGPYSRVFVLREGYPVLDVMQEGQRFLCDSDGRPWRSADLAARFPDLLSSLPSAQYSAVMQSWGEERIRIAEQLSPADYRGADLLVQTYSSIPVYYFEHDTVRGYRRGLSEVIWEARVDRLKDLSNVSYAMPVSYRPPLTTATYANSHLAHISTKLLGNSESLSKGFHVEVFSETGGDEGRRRVARLINATKDTVWISSWGGGMTLLQQAKDSRGVWRDIETSLTPICSQDYMIYSFSPRSYIRFPLREYSGPLNTTLRLKCEYAREEGETVVEETVYSNEYRGRVHPGQFWQEAPSSYFYPEPVSVPILPYFP